MKSNDVTYWVIADIAIAFAKNSDWRTVQVDDVMVPRDVWLDQAERYLNGDIDAFCSTSSLV